MKEWLLVVKRRKEITWIYNALSQVAGRNGIHGPSPQFGNASAHLQDQDQGHENEHEHEHEENHKNLVGQA